MKALHFHRALATTFFAVVILILAGCSGTGTPHPPTVSSVAVTPTNPSIAVGATQQFTATGSYSDGSTKDITSTVAWSSGTTATATISSGGLATSVAGGTSTITAKIGSVSGSTTLTVVAAVTLNSISVTPKNPSIILGATQQFTATGTYSDASTKDITATVTWSSGTLATATISASGLATSVAGGTSLITATSGTVSGNTTLKVITLVSIAVTPANPSVGLGGTQQFTATGTYSDASTKDLTASVTWASLTTANATITAGGLATAVHAGTSTITATLGAVPPGTTLLTITGPTLVSIQISPANPTIPIGGTADFTGVGFYSDGSTLPLAPITWSSGTSSTASIFASSGISLGLAVGTSTITATGGGVTGTTLLTVAAPISRFAYVANGGDGTISIYAVNGSTFTPRGYANDTGRAVQAIPDLSGRFVFALNGVSSTISTYAVNPVTGGLTDLSATVTPVANGPAPGYLPAQGVIDPTGRFLYVVNFVDQTLNPVNSVTAFKISTTDGSLTPIGTTPVGPLATAILTMGLVDRTGKFLYVVDDGDSEVFGFSIDPSSGALTALSTAVPAFPAATGNSPNLAAIDPQNRYLYVADIGSDDVAGFTINSTTGALTPIAGSPFPVVVGSQPFAVGVDPSGKYLYVVNAGLDSVSGYPIGAGGVLGAALFTPVSTIPTSTTVGAFPVSISIDPAGTYVAVPNQSVNTVALFNLNSTTGALTSAGNIESRSTPTFANIYAATSTPTLLPAAVFATNTTAGTVSAYTVTSGTGALVPTVGVVNGAPGNATATTDVTGQFFYTTGAASKELAAFGITQPTAALAAFTGSPYTLASTPSSVVAEPSDTYVFTALTGTPGSVQGYTLAANALTPIAGPASVTSLNAFVDDPQGQSLYGLGNSFLQILPINNNTGAITSGATLTTAGTWTAAAVDASGQYLIALDSVGKKIQVFNIATNASVTTFTVNTATNASVSSVGTTPISLVIDPLNRFVYVTDAASNTILHYTYSPLTGELTSPATTPLAGVQGQAAIDATGAYLYVAVEGTPVTNPGSVAVFKINADGTLTAVTGSPFAAGVGTSGVAVSNSIK